MKKKIYLDQKPVCMFFKKRNYKIYYNGLIPNTHEFLERYFTHITLGHYNHEQINNGTKIEKMDGDP